MLSDLERRYLLPLFALAVLLVLAYFAGASQSLPDSVGNDCKWIGRSPPKSGVSAPNPQIGAHTRQADGIPSITGIGGESADDNGTSPEKDHDGKKFEREIALYTCRLADLTSYLVIATAVLGIIALWQLAQLWRTNSSAEKIERAYVKMSHKSPGLIEASPPGDFFVGMKVSNSGNTPATVTAIHLEARFGERLEASATYGEERHRMTTNIFLVKDDDFIHRRTFAHADAAAIRTAVANRELRLWLIGYVDYIDAFQKRRRGGHARLFENDPVRGGGDTNNLIFGNEAGYNYDRERNRDEGNDW